MSERLVRRVRTREAVYIEATPFMTFAVVRPSGHLDRVIYSPSVEASWECAFDLCDDDEIAEHRAEGWRVVPCTVEFEIEEDGL